MKPRREPKRQPPTAAGPAPRSAPSPAIVAAGLFLLALAVRAIHLAQIDSAPFTTIVMGDSKSYDAWAQQIAAGDWIGRDVFYQAPLYPYFLGVIYSVAGHDVMAVRAVQSVLGAVAVVLIAHAAARLISPRAGVVAGIIAALYPTSIFFDGLIQKTALDAFLSAAALWIVSGMLAAPATWRAWAALGVVMAALSLARENALALVVVLLGWCLLGAPGAPAARPRSRVRHAAAFTVGLALLLFPVALRNYAVGGGFYLTTSQFGPNLYLGNNARTDGTAGSLIAGRGSAEFERQDASALAERAAGRPLTPAEISSYWTDQTLQYIRSQPGDWIRLMLRKTALLWNAYEAFDTESQESYAEYSAPLRWLGWCGHFGVLVPLAFAGIWMTWGDRRRLAILYVLIAVYAASVVVFFIYARYRYPLVPSLVLFASAALVRGSAFLRTEPRPTIAALAASIAALAVFSNWPLLASGTTRAVSEHNLGAALQSEGRTDAAIEHYRKAIDIAPEYAPAYSNLGTALMARGERAAAIDMYRQAISIAPDFADAHFNLGNALRADDRPTEAVASFERALQYGPETVDARTNLGLALADSGRIDEGITALRRAAHLAPENAQALYPLGRLLLEAGRPDQAIEPLRSVVRIAPTPVAHNDLGIALASTGRIDDAIEQFAAALKLDSSFTEARRNLAAAQAETSQPQP